MIKLTQLTELFENGLNSILNNPEIQIKIWSEVGDYQKSRRNGNIITYFINGNLRTSTSANDANALVMGVNGLSLEFSVPLKRPRTNATQSEEELSKIKDGQYPFVAEIVNVINSFFQKAQSTTLYDESGAEFSVAFQAGTAVPGTVDIAAQVNQSIPVSVYIEVYFIQGGINSKNVTVTFDDSNVNFQAVRKGRSPMTEQDVYAGKLISKSIVTSTAFAIDVDFPASADALTQECINYLFEAEPNVAHFVDVQFGNYSKMFLMTLNAVQTSAQGIAIAGLSASLMEVVENASAVDVPNSFQTGKFTVTSSDIERVTFTPSVDCKAFIAGETLSLNGGAAVTVALNSAAFEYGENGEYYVYLITDKAVAVSNSSAVFTVEKEAARG